MRIVVVGAGKIGSNLAKMLIERGNEVIIIDYDEERCSKLSAEVDALIIKGDATKLETLRDAEVDKADVFIAVTDRDEVNVLSCLIAKQMGSTRTIARVGDSRLIEVVEALGVERAICPELVTARLLSDLVTGRYGVSELLTSEGGFKLLDIILSASS
ncbi:MAG: TrkA family potassium uptake protein, partial [Thermoprotei archaeon]